MTKPILREVEEIVRGHVPSGRAGMLVKMHLSRGHGQLLAQEERPHPDQLARPGPSSAKAIAQTRRWRVSI